MGISDKIGRPTIFLDRDGVLNGVTLRDGRPHPPMSAAETSVLPGVASTIDRLRRAGYEFVVVTNQPDVARGAQSRAQVEAINDTLGRDLGIEEFRVCYHDDADDCECRKPRPGLILDAARELGLDLARSYMVGDRWRDVDAGRRAGVRTIWIDCGYAERPATGFDLRVDSLPAAADWILKAHKEVP